MQITSKIHTTESLAQAVATASANYGGNLVADLNHVAGNRYRLKVNANDSRGPGARRSASGRRGPYACWHGFRDVIAAIFLVDPDARIATGLTVYRGAENFLQTYPATGDRNVGSMINPVTMPDLCDCN